MEIFLESAAGIIVGGTALLLARRYPAVATGVVLLVIATVWAGVNWSLWSTGKLGWLLVSAALDAWTAFVALSLILTSMRSPRLLFWRLVAKVFPRVVVRRILRRLRADQRVLGWLPEEFNRFFMPSANGKELERWRVEIVQWRLSAPGVRSWFTRLPDDDGDDDDNEWEIRALIFIDRKSFRYLDLDIQVVDDACKEIDSGDIGFIRLAAYPLVGFMRFHDEDLYAGQYWPAAQLTIAASAWRELFADVRIEVLRGNEKPRIDLFASPIRPADVQVLFRPTWEEFVAAAAKTHTETFTREGTGKAVSAQSTRSNISFHGFRVGISRGIVPSKFTRERLPMMPFAWDRVLE